MSEPASVRDTIRQIRIELRIFNGKVAAAAGLNLQDLDILDVIDREGPCTPSQLADRTGYPRATLTGILARLEREHWITREHDPSDRRSVALTSTARFDDLHSLYAPLYEIAATLTQRLTAEEALRLRRALVEVASRVRNLST